MFIERLVTVPDILMGYVLRCLSSQGLSCPGYLTPGLKSWCPDGISPYFPITHLSSSSMVT